MYDSRKPLKLFERQEFGHDQFALTSKLELEASFVARPTDKTTLIIAAII